MNPICEAARKYLPLILTALISAGVSIWIVTTINKPVAEPATTHKLAPAPKILSSYGDCSSTILGEYSYRVATMVRNDGEDGRVTVRVTVVQGEESWTKRTSKNVKKNETEEFVIIFDEVRFLRAHPTHSASVSCTE